ncbi:MAG TPA: hypothetical protein VF997_07060, partial [Polyangia bacterium]
MATLAPSVHRVTGTFVDRDLEAEYLREAFALTLQPFRRFTVTLSALIFISYGIHDYFVMPATVLHEAWIIRYTLGLPMLAVVLPLVWSRAARRLQ